MTALLCRFSLESYGTVSSISVITRFLIRTMSRLVDVARIETETVEEEFLLVHTFLSKNSCADISALATRVKARYRIIGKERD